jgi:hypothetical protein
MVFQPFGQHPYVLYGTGTDAMGRFWIVCRCRICGPSAEWRKQCTNPSRVNQWVGMYALEHGHGLQPVRPR